MTVSPEQASQALSEIADAQARSATLYDYWRGGPHLILWGILWIVGFGLSSVFPTYAAVIWDIGTPVGIVAGIVLDRRQTGQNAVRRWLYPAVVLTLFAFIFASFAVMNPRSDDQRSAFIGLVVAFGYVLLGLRIGVRYIVVGLLLAALILVGFFVLSRSFSLWMAVVGGGALLLAGFWLRKL